MDTRAHDSIQKWIDRMLDELTDRLFHASPRHHFGFRQAWPRRHTSPNYVGLGKGTRWNFKFRVDAVTATQHPQDDHQARQPRGDDGDILPVVAISRYKENQLKYAKKRGKRLAGTRPSNSLLRSLEGDVFAAAWLAAENDTYIINRFVRVARLAINDKRNLSSLHPWDSISFTMCLGVLRPLSSLVAQAVTGELAAPQWEAAISRVLSRDKPCINGALPNLTSLRSTGLFFLLVQKLSEHKPVGAHVKRLQRALDDVLHAMARGTLSRDDGVSALLRLLAGTARLTEKSSRAVIMVQRILSELAALARPPLALADEACGMLSGLVQEPFLASLMAYLPTVPLKDTAEFGDSHLYSGMGLSARTSRTVFLAAATLARRGDHVGTKHGCLLVVEGARGSQPDLTVDTSLDNTSDNCSDVKPADIFPRILGEGWNHLLDIPGSDQRDVVHAECHAIADAIRKHGEDGAFAAFRSATAWIIELRDDVGYDYGPPCGNCERLLKALGVPRVVHSTLDGSLRELSLPHKPELLAEAVESTHLIEACAELGVHCARLADAFSIKRAAWIKSGRHVCRHGVFFDRPSGTTCQCTNEHSDMELWAKAKFMPAMDSTLRCIVVVPFANDRFQPLYKLKARVKQLGWCQLGVAW